MDEMKTEEAKVFGLMAPDVEELQTMILSTTRAIHFYGIETCGKAKEEQTLITAARDLIKVTSAVLLPSVFLPSGDPCTRCHGSGVEPGSATPR